MHEPWVKNDTKLHTPARPISAVIATSSVGYCKMKKSEARRFLPKTPSPSLIAAKAVIIQLALEKIEQNGEFIIDHPFIKDIHISILLPI